MACLSRGPDDRRPRTSRASIACVVASALSLSACMGPPPKYDGEVGRGVNLWPLVEVSYDEEGRETDIIWPIFGFDNKTDHKLYAFRPVFMIRTDPESRVTSADILFPFFHTARKGTRREFAFRPLFGVWRDPAEEMTDVDFLIPIGYWRSEPGKRWFQIRPIVWYKNTEDTGYFHIVPLYGQNRSGEENRYWFLTPFVTYWRDAGWDPPDWTFNAFWPLLHLDRVGDRSRSWFFPLFYRNRDSLRRALVVTPLFWNLEKRSVSDPAVVKSRSLLVLPFYGRIDRPGKRTWRSFGGNLLIVGKGDGEGSVNVLWPLFHHGWTPEEENTWLLPLFWRFKFERGLIFLAPPVLHFKGEHVKGTFLWPAFGYWRDKDYREYSTAYPFFWYGSDGKDRRKLAFALPFLYHSREADDRWAWNLLLPFGRHARSGSELHSRFFPLYLYWRDSGDKTWSFHFLWPFFGVKKGYEGHRSVDLLRPFIQHSRSVSKVHSRFFPFYLYWGYPGQEGHSLHILWPLVHHKVDEDETSFRLLLPYVTYRGQEEGHDFRVFWKWIQSTETKDFYTFRFNPFFRWDRNVLGDRYWSVLGGLLSRKRTGEDVRWKILWLIGL